MKGVLEELFPPKRNSKWDAVKVILLLMGIIAGCWMIFKVSMDGVISYRVTQAKQDKANCVGEYNTIPCHQYKIEQLLLESRRPK
ncbi:hypothetical protein D3C79_49340 [compost metagenome]